jgi:hypothetical protein
VVAVLAVATVREKVMARNGSGRAIADNAGAVPAYLPPRAPPVAQGGGRGRLGHGG